MEIIFQRRSYSKCISDSYELFCNNFATIFRNTWKWVLAHSVVCAIFAAIINSTGVSSYLSMAASGIFVVADFLLISCVKGCFIKLVRGADKAKTNTLRIIKANLLALFIALILPSLIFLCLYAIAISLSVVGINIILICLWIFFMLLVCCIFLYPYAGLLIGYEKFSGVIFKHYLKVGLHFGGYNLILLILFALLCLVVSIFLSLPSYIITLAYQIDYWGVLNGDNSGIPTYFPLLVLLSIGIMSFVMSYVMIWIDMVCIYAYGNAKKYMEEHNK